MMIPRAAVKIESRVQGPVAVVALSGRLTVNDNPGVLKEAVADVVRQGARHVILDLAGVNYIDSTRLGELIAAHVTVSRLGSHLKLAATPARVVELLTLAGLGDVFERFASVEAAVASLDAHWD
jgi:anti-sigma B factor antagonist